MDVLEVGILMVAGVVGGGLNAVAGGGTFITFPVLMAMGLDPITAVGSNAVAIYPGHAAAMLAHRGQLKLTGPSLVRRCAIAATGGLIGALMLLWTGSKIFVSLVPFLILMATLLFMFSPAINRRSQNTRSNSGIRNGMVELFFAIYGGYFGAGLGVLIMAALTMVGVRDVHEANAQKNLIATIITTFSVITFACAGVVAWPQTACVFLGATIGGRAGAFLAQVISSAALRRFVIATGFCLSVLYFLKL